MALDANSYGTVLQVAALTPLYATVSNSFSTTTRPTLSQVETFIDQVSATINLLLAAQGFSIPVTQADAARALAGFVVLEVVSLVEYANGAGPFIVEASQLRAATPSRIILKDAEAFIASHAVGFEALGVTRTRSLAFGLDAEDVTPIWDTEWSG